jgi:hypothetical protein
MTQNYLFFGSSVNIYNYVVQQLKDEKKEKTDKFGMLKRRIATTISSFHFRLGGNNQYRGDHHDMDDISELYNDDIDLFIKRFG